MRRRREIGRAGDLGCSRVITIDETGERVSQRRVGLAHRPAQVIRHDAQRRLIDNLGVAARCSAA